MVVVDDTRHRERGGTTEVITDPLTARIVGALLVFMPVATVVSAFFVTKPEVSHRPGFLVFVAVTALPLVALGVHFWRRAAKLKG